MCNGHYNQCSLCATVITINAAYVQRSSQSTQLMCNGHYNQRSLCATFITINAAYVQRSLQSMQLMCNGHYNQRSVCATFITINAAYVQRSLQSMRLMRNVHHNQCMVALLGLGNKIEAVAYGWCSRMPVGVPCTVARSFHSFSATSSPKILPISKKFGHF
jgi:uncharacterized membrane protein YwzB